METTDGYDRRCGARWPSSSVSSPSPSPRSTAARASATSSCRGLRGDGAALLCAPYFSTVALAANAVLTSGDESAMKYLLPGMASGETIGTLAINEDNGRWDFDGIGLAATRSGEDWVLNGHKSYVIDGMSPTSFSSPPARRRRHPLGVKGDAAGLTRTPLPTMDQTRKQARLEFADTPAWLIGTDAAPNPASRRPCSSLPWPSPRSRSAARRRLGHGRRVTRRPASSSAPHRQLPGHQAQVRRTCCSRSSRPSRGVLRRVGRCRGFRRAAGRRQPRQVLLLGGVLPRRRREHPDPRWHRLHLGAPRPPVLQAAKSSELPLR